MPAGVARPVPGSTSSTDAVDVSDLVRPPRRKTRAPEAVTAGRVSGAGSRHAAWVAETATGVVVVVTESGPCACRGDGPAHAAATKPTSASAVPRTTRLTGRLPCDRASSGPAAGR